MRACALIDNEMAANGSLSSTFDAGSENFCLRPRLASNLTLDFCFEII